MSDAARTEPELEPLPAEVPASWPVARAEPEVAPIPAEVPLSWPVATSDPDETDVAELEPEICPRALSCPELELELVADPATRAATEGWPDAELVAEVDAEIGATVLG